MVAKTSAGTQNHQSYYFYQLLVAAPQVQAPALKNYKVHVLLYHGLSPSVFQLRRGNWDNLGTIIYISPSKHIL